MFEKEQDLRIYKKLLQLLKEYVIKFPNSNINKLFENLIERGIKTIPKDSETLTELENILDKKKSMIGKIQEILNKKLLNIKEV